VTAPVIWWVRRDLRLADNPALTVAAAQGEVLPTFVVDPRLWGPAGGPRRAFLARALAGLRRSCGGALAVRRGRPAEVLPALVAETGARLVIAAADGGPYGRSRDEAVAAALAGRVEVRLVGSPYAVDPGRVRKADGEPFRVFTPFSRAWVSHGWEPPLPAPAQLRFHTGVEAGALPVAPESDVELPEPTEEAARARLDAFVRSGLDDYGARRNLPGADATSRLSADLHFGLLHPRTLLAEVDTARAGHLTWRSELCWREFYADVLWHHPASARRALTPRMAALAVDTGADADRRFSAWAEGRTGYPIVDAGMRQLLAEAWMHNRVRMIAASFLVKDLHLDWQRGARWFMAHLVDGDLASNSHGWQWVAGSGTDAAPYVRVFNPVLQGRRFDPDGSYVRRWVPELACLPDRFVHAPWEAPVLPLAAADYPSPIVDHATERTEALARYERLGPAGP